MITANNATHFTAAVFHFASNQQSSPPAINMMINQVSIIKLF
jgi:hypothetical protein